MKFSFLKQIVTEAANQLKENAAHSGSWGDGGSDWLLSKLNKFKNDIIIRLDLRPSEINQINDIEVGEPKEFFDVIENYKINLVKNIKL